MKTNEIREDLGTFDAPVIGITLFEGIPRAVIVFHDGKIVTATLAEEHTGGVPVGTKNRGRDVTVITAPGGMTVRVESFRTTKDSVRDFKVYRETSTAYNVLSIDYRQS
ncbi:MAG: hypothetical protein LBV63_02200 [Candidatus Methanoplasma sp.]|jgi:hypothetical protein|nr:hypothetical protein [Candidatus Methanoplasma sp.]